jgi:hypothetical protein
MRSISPGRIATHRCHEWETANSRAGAQPPETLTRTNCPWQTTRTRRGRRCPPSSFVRMTVTQCPVSDTIDLDQCGVAVRLATFLRASVQATSSHHG